VVVFYEKLSFLWAVKYAKNALAMPPKPWIKKLKLSYRVTHIDALAVAVINDHETAHKRSSFAPFQAYLNTKKSVQLMHL